MTANDARQHIEDIKNEIGDLLFLKVTLEREIELLQPKIESKIVKPVRATNLSTLTKADLEVDLVPIGMANMEMVQMRKQFYYARMELAGTLTAIEAKKVLLNTYFEHIQQELQKQSKPLTEEMIFDVFRRCQDIKDKTPEESTAIKDIGDNLVSYLNRGKEKKLEIFETLQNIVKQHEI